MICLIWKSDNCLWPKYKTSELTSWDIASAMSVGNIRGQTGASLDNYQRANWRKTRQEFLLFPTLVFGTLRLNYDQWFMVNCHSLWLKLKLMLSSVWKCIWQTISLFGIADCCYDVWQIDVNVRWSNMMMMMVMMMTRMMMMMILTYSFCRTPLSWWSEEGALMLLSTSSDHNDNDVYNNDDDHDDDKLQSSSTSKTLGAKVTS